MEYKQCKGCSETKNVLEFSKKDKHRRNGLCKECFRENWAYWVIKRVSSSNSKKGIIKPKELNPKFLKSLMESQGNKCYWLGIDLDLTNKCFFTKPSLDRIDNSKGYEIDNVVLSSLFANRGRCDNSAESMRIFINNLKINP